jgi:hypothetical protein
MAKINPASAARISMKIHTDNGDYQADRPTNKNAP